MLHENVDIEVIKAINDLLTDLATTYLKLDCSNDPLTDNLDLGSNKIVNLLDPTLAQDAATKIYVDGVIGGVGIGFKTITGITNDVVADMVGDTLTLTSANTKLAIVGTALTDTITFTIDETQIDHDALLNFDALEHYTKGSISIADLGIKDHDLLDGLLDDDHTQYLLVNGTRAMTGNLDMGANNIIVGGTVDGIDISAISLSNMPVAAAGNIDCGTQAITNVGNVDGVDVSAIIAFTTISCPAGTNPVADLLADTLNITATGDITITGNAGTDTIDFSVTKYTNAEAVAAVVTADDYIKNDANDIMTGDLTVNNLITAGNVDGIDISAISITNMPTAVNNWKVYCTNGAGVMTEIATGAVGTILTGNGVAAAPSFQVGGAAGDAFKTITGITNDVVADVAADTLTLVAAGGLTIVGTAATDTITFTNTITQYTDVMVENVITAELVNGQSIDNRIDALLTANADGYQTQANVEAIIDAEIVNGQSIDNAIDALINTHNVANRHIDHSAVTITAGVGLSGGGTIAANRTIDCDITQYTDALARTACVSDVVYGAGWNGVLTIAASKNAVYDKIAAMDILIAANTTVAEATAAADAKITVECGAGQTIDNAIDALINAHNVANRHIDHSAVTITAGVGLSGGGTIAANRTIDCDITQYTDALARAACVSNTAYAASWNGVTTIAPSKNAVYDKIETLPQMKVGTYVGTGLAQSVAGVGFQPKIIWTYGITAAETNWFKHESMGLWYSARMDLNIYVDNTCRIDADGFSMNPNNNQDNWNYTGKTYVYYALG